MYYLFPKVDEKKNPNEVKLSGGQARKAYNYNTALATRCLGDCKFAYMWLTENSSGARVFSSPHVGKFEIPWAPSSLCRVRFLT